MCETCWNDAGRPRIVNEKTKAAALLATAVYQARDGIVGGNLHIVLDDWNVEDGDLQFCRAEIAAQRERPADEHGCDPAQLHVETLCLGAFEQLSMPERNSALAIQYGLLSVGGDDGLR